MNFEVKIILNEENFKEVLKDLNYEIRFYDKVFNDIGEYTGIQIFDTCITLSIGGHKHNWTVFRYKQENYIQKLIGLNKSYVIGNESSYFSLSQKY